MFSERFQLHSHALQYVLLAFTIIFLECYADDLVTNGTSMFNPQEILRYNAIVAERLQHDNASFVRKMSMDEGEKFWLGYWGFSEHEEGDGLSASFDNRYQARAAALVHSPILPSSDFHQRGLNIFGKRAFNCPSGTSSCSSIKRPTSCCGNGETCQIITDTGLGDVGCCPDGEVCSGEVSSCASGYTPCSPSIGGGCCIQGYECVSDGCTSNVPLFLRFVTEEDC
jgi:progranulin